MKRYAAIIAVALACAGNSLAQEATSSNLLTNASFEDGEAGESPSGWGKWTRFSKESVFRKETGGHNPGSQGMAVLIKSPEDEFLLGEQSVARALKVGDRYGFAVWLRAEKPVMADVYISCVAFDDAGNFKAESENRRRVELSAEWTRYTSSVAVAKGKDSMRGAIRCLVQTWRPEDNGVCVEMDDAELLELGAVEPTR